METSVNNKCRAFTSLEQSKKLAEILPLETADMHYNNASVRGVKYVDNYRLEPYCYKEVIKENWTLVYKNHNPLFEVIPAWSLTALIELLPPELWITKHYFLEISKMGDNSTPYEVRYYRFKEDWEGAGFGRMTHISYSSNDLIDACYEMIIKLSELKML